MKTTEINFVRDFTDCPGGRLRINGEYSGEEFREDLLKPALRDNELVIVKMDGAFGFPSSFIDEAFGVLVAQLGYDTVKKKIKVELNDDELAKKEIEDCMRAHFA